MSYFNISLTVRGKVERMSINYIFGGKKKSRGGGGGGGVRGKGEGGRGGGRRNLCDVQRINVT